MLAAMAAASVLVVGQTPVAAQEVVGVSVPVLANPFWQRYVAFVNQVGDQLGIKVNIVDCQNQEAKQLQDIENLIASGVTELIVTPQTAQVGPVILKRAQEANIPVVITDRWPDVDPTNYAWDGFVGFIGPDDADAGFRIAQTLAAAGKKDLVAINGVHGASVAEGRFKGLDNFAKANPDVKLLDTQWIGETSDFGLQTMENYEAAYSGKYNGVWNYNDALATGAIKALRDAGKGEDLKSGKIAVAGMDLNPDAVELVQQGYYLASFGGHWLQGGFGLVMLHDYVKGKPPEAQYRVVRLKLMEVNRQNVSKFMDQFINNPPTIDARKLSRVTNPEASGQYFFNIEIK
jgi:ABC-type sugar transport system substrate-binding protein